MKKFFFLLLMVCILAFNKAVAEEGDNQILVFLKNGEVKLFFDNKLEGIEASCFDSDSIKHEEVVSQVFCNLDGSKTLIPVADIDSVAFGNHNIVDIIPDVHIIDETELEFIVRFDKENNILYYKSDTPSHILPYTGEKLFYGNFTQMFPWGLGVRVISVKTEDSLKKVTLEDIELSEIFSKLFYAGNADLFDEKDSSNLKGKRRIKIPLGKGCSLSVEAGGEASASNIVINPLKGQYHVDFEGEVSYEMDFEMESEDSAEWYDEVPIIGFAPPVIRAAEAIGVLRVDLDVIAFLEMIAQLKIDYSMTRKYPFKISWDRNRNQTTCNNIATEDDTEHEYIDEARIEFVLDGEIYTGLGLVFRLATLADRLGTNLRIRLGTEFASSVGFGVVRELEEEYNAENYAKGKLSCCGKLEVDVTAFSHIFGDRNNTLFDYEIRFGEREFNLFPNFEHSRAVAHVGQPDNDAEGPAITEVSVASVNSAELAAPIETGYALNGENDEKIDEIFFDEPLEDNSKEVQPLKHTFKTTKKSEKLRVQPVFKYQDHTIKAKPIPIQNDVMIQPIVFQTNNGAVNVLSGMPIIGSASNENTFILVGNYFPLEFPDTIFSENGAQKHLNIGTYLNDDDKNKLIGTWYGSLSDNSFISLIFNEEGTGKYSVSDINETFSYTLNTPQSGDITLLINNKSKVLKILEISDTFLTVYLPDKKEKCKLIK